jgi:hypothetical protein
MALGISGLAFAGATALTLGAAAPAGAQTARSAPQHSHSVISHLLRLRGRLGRMLGRLLRRLLVLSPVSR